LTDHHSKSGGDSLSHDFLGSRPARGREPKMGNNETINIREDSSASKEKLQQPGANVVRYRWVGEMEGAKDKGDKYVQ